MTAEEFALYEVINMKASRKLSNRAGFIDWRVTLSRKGYKERRYTIPFVEGHVPTLGEVLRLLSNEAATFESCTLYENLILSGKKDNKETMRAYKRSRKIAADMDSFVDDYDLFLNLE